MKEVKEGRGSPHGGAFLDIANRQPSDYIKKKLPSMYHQFKVLAELDITKEPMEVGPTCHYFMGGIRVDADTAMSSVPEWSHLFYIHSFLSYKTALAYR